MYIFGVPTLLFHAKIVMTLYGILRTPRGTILFFCCKYGVRAG